jgi:hypothetical protein
LTVAGGGESAIALALVVAIAIAVLVASLVALAVRRTDRAGQAKHLSKRHFDEEKSKKGFFFFFFSLFFRLRTIANVEKIV